MQLTWSQICFHRLLKKKKKKKDQCILREELTLQYPNRGRKGFPGGSEVKNPTAVQVTRLPSLCREDPLEEGMATTPVFLPGESHGQRSRGLLSIGPRRVRPDWSNWAHREKANALLTAIMLFFTHTAPASPSNSGLRMAVQVKIWANQALWLCYNSEFHQRGRSWVNRFHLSVRISIVMARTVVCTVFHPGVWDWLISHYVFKPKAWTLSRVKNDNWVFLKFTR